MRCCRLVQKFPKLAVSVLMCFNGNLKCFMNNLNCFFCRTMAVSTLLPNSLFVGGPSTRLNYYMENDRLTSFEGWPLPFLSPIELAKAGFYYTKKEDIVRCPFCSIELSKWEPGDDVVSDHERWAPQCLFVRCVLKNDTNAAAGEDVCGNFETYTPNEVPEHNAILSGLENLVVPCKTPLYPEYGTYDLRLKTFEHWPKALKQRPEQLVEAGFFYIGQGDRCVCFHCGGGLNHWEVIKTHPHNHKQQLKTNLCYSLMTHLGNNTPTGSESAVSCF